MAAPPALVLDSNKAIQSDGSSTRQVQLATNRTASSDYGAYTLPSADNVGSLKPHMQVVKARRTQLQI